MASAKARVSHLVIFVVRSNAGCRFVGNYEKVADLALDHGDLSHDEALCDSTNQTCLHGWRVLRSDTHRTCLHGR